MSQIKSLLSQTLTVAAVFFFVLALTVSRKGAQDAADYIAMIFDSPAGLGLSLGGFLMLLVAVCLAEGDGYSFPILLILVGLVIMLAFGATWKASLDHSRSFSELADRKPADQSAIDFIFFGKLRPGVFSRQREALSNGQITVTKEELTLTTEASSATFLRATYYDATGSPFKRITETPLRTTVERYEAEKWNESDYKLYLYNGKSRVFRFPTYTVQVGIAITLLGGVLAAIVSVLSSWRRPRSTANPLVSSRTMESRPPLKPGKFLNRILPFVPIVVTILVGVIILRLWFPLNNEDVKLFLTSTGIILGLFFLSSVGDCLSDRAKLLAKEGLGRIKDTIVPTFDRHGLLIRTSKEGEFEKAMWYLLLAAVCFLVSLAL